MSNNLNYELTLNCKSFIYAKNKNNTHKKKPNFKQAERIIKKIGESSPCPNAVLDALDNKQ